MSDSLVGDPRLPVARRSPRRSTWKQMLITLACGLLFTVGGFFGFVETCSYEGAHRQANQAFVWITLAGFVVTMLGLVWGLVEFVLFAVRRYKDGAL